MSTGITLKQGNIFDSQAQALVCPVNCVKVMGAGLAKQFKIKFPDCEVIYKAFIDEGKLKVEKPAIWTDIITGKKIVFFPTKNHWMGKSNILWVARGLNWFLDNYQAHSIKSVAFPLLGAGLGGLKKDDVKAVMTSYLSKAENLEVEIYEN